MAQADNNLSECLGIIVVLHKKIMGAGYDQYNVRIKDLFRERWQPLQKPLCRLTKNTQVDDLKMRYPFLPVKIGEMGITEEKQSALFHVCVSIEAIWGSRHSQIIVAFIYGKNGIRSRSLFNHTPKGPALGHLFRERHSAFPGCYNETVGNVMVIS